MRQPFDALVQAHDAEAIPSDAATTMPPASTPARPDDALQGEREREPGRERRRAADVLRPMPQHRIAERRRDAEPARSSRR